MMEIHIFFSDSESDKLIFVAQNLSYCVLLLSKIKLVPFFRSLSSISSLEANPQKNTLSNMFLDKNGGGKTVPFFEEKM